MGLVGIEMGRMMMRMQAGVIEVTFGRQGGKGVAGRASAVVLVDTIREW